MHLFYFDEVKFERGQQDSYWLGCIGVTAEDAQSVTQEVSDLAYEVFATKELIAESEFHGIDLARSKGRFKGDYDRAFSTLCRLLKVLASDKIIRGYIRVNPARMRVADYEKTAFMFLLEQIQQLLEERNSVGMLFGDYDDKGLVSKIVREFSRYQNYGTEWRGARKIDRVIDTIHFARSHHSRLIQLADVYLYCSQFMARDNQSFWRLRLAKAIESSGMQSTTFAKNWP